MNKKNHVVASKVVWIVGGVFVWAGVSQFVPSEWNGFLLIGIGIAFFIFKDTIIKWF